MGTNYDTYITYFLLGVIILQQLVIFYANYVVNATNKDINILIGINYDISEELQSYYKAEDMLREVVNSPAPKPDVKMMN